MSAAGYKNRQPPADSYASGSRCGAGAFLPLTKQRISWLRGLFGGVRFAVLPFRPEGLPLLSLPAFEGALQVPLVLPNLFLLLAGEETLEVLVLARQQPVDADSKPFLEPN